MIETAQEEVVDTVHQVAQTMIVEGYLPAPYQIDPHDMRPLWDFTGLALMLDQRPDQLVELLKENGPVHLRGTGIPSSWQLLLES